MNITTTVLDVVSAGSDSYVSILSSAVIFLTLLWKWILIPSRLPAMHPTSFMFKTRMFSYVKRILMTNVTSSRMTSILLSHFLINLRSISESQVYLYQQSSVIADFGLDLNESSGLGFADLPNFDIGDPAEDDGIE